MECASTNDPDLAALAKNERSFKTCRHHLHVLRQSQSPAEIEDERGMFSAGPERTHVSTSMGGAMLVPADRVINDKDGVDVNAMPIEHVH